MSDTPETDAAYKYWPSENAELVDAEFARNLERERDEAREDAAHWKTEYEIVVARLCGKKHPRDNGIISEHEIIPKLTQERDEAREHLAAIKHYLTKERDDALAQIVQAECRAERFCQERDEAREQLVRSNHFLHQAEENLESIYRERDEARDQSRWKSTKVALPTAGEWVLHTYKGVRAPEYGIYERGHFFRGGGPESFPATHWLSVPNISCVKCGETLRGDEDESETHCKWCVQGWESSTSDPTEAAK